MDPLLAPSLKHSSIKRRIARRGGRRGTIYGIHRDRSPLTSGSSSRCVGSRCLSCPRLDLRWNEADTRDRASLLLLPLSTITLDHRHRLTAVDSPASRIHSALNSTRAENKPEEEEKVAFSRF